MGIARGGGKHKMGSARGIKVPDWVGIGKREWRASQGVRFVIDLDGFFVISNGGKYRDSLSNMHHSAYLSTHTSLMTYDWSKTRNSLKLTCDHGARLGYAPFSVFEHTHFTYDL